MDNKPVDKIMENVDSKYSLVVIAAKRARQITSRVLEDEQNGIKSDYKNPVTEALRDVCDGRVEWCDAAEEAEEEAAEEAAAAEEVEEAAEPAPAEDAEDAE